MNTELTLKETVRAIRASRRISARQHWQFKRGIHNTFGKTVCGVNPWRMPSDGLNFSGRQAKDWERQQYHRATRRESKREVAAAIQEMNEEFVLDAEELEEVEEFVLDLEEVEEFLSSCFDRASIEPLTGRFLAYHAS